tara:strand:- start:48 stop:638 length:591 start_codon:yes stop_codon:yes gene_type:complete
MSKKTIETLSETYVEGMSQIYLLIDMNGLTYVGTTRLIFSDRWNTHISDKNSGHFCSSQMLDWSTLMVYHLETCAYEDKSLREGYWMTRYPDCVNIRRNVTVKKYKKVSELDKDEVEAQRLRGRQYYAKNSKAIIKQKQNYYARNEKAMRIKKDEYYIKNKALILFKSQQRYQLKKQREKLSLIEITDFLELINHY